MGRQSEHPYIPKLKQLFAEGGCDRREFLRTATLLGVSATAAYAFVGKVTGESVAFAQAALPKGGTARISVRIRQFESAHKANFVPPSNCVRQVCEYLSKTGYDNVTRPYLLEKWEPSPDLKTWTLHVRRTVKWRKGGRLLNADDVVWNLRQVLDPAVGSSVLGLMKGYMMEDVPTGEKNADGTAKLTARLWDSKAIEKVDDFTVRLNLKQAQLGVPEHLFHYPLAITDPAEGEKFAPGTNGTGPFDLVEYDIGRRATFKARKDYWGQGPYLDELVFVDLGDDPGADVAALASRQIHLASAMGASQLEPCKRIPHLVYYPADTAASAHARMHPVPPFNDKRVRQAMRYAVDCKTVAEVALGEIGSPGEHHHVSPIHPEYAKLPPFNRDLAKAKKLLAEAGHPGGIDIEFNCPNGSWQRDVSQVMVQQWADAGIRAKLNIIPSTEYNKNWTEYPLGFTDWSHRPLGVMCLSLGYRTGVPWNESKYSNPEFDRLLTEAEATADVEKRRGLVRQLEMILQDDGPLVQPIWRKVFCFADQKLKGFKMHPTQYVFGEEYGVEA
ncbi:MAG: ABC transporter substrate-binding protein [Proteobacteria bacterium]|nr:ABC transporter substrate-binding protein [Pseudomonadota bacterium]